MFIRIRTIKGRQYRYLEKRWREGGKVRSKSFSLGPMEGEDPTGWKLIHEQMAQYPWPRTEEKSAPAKAGAPTTPAAAAAPAAATQTSSEASEAAPHSPQGASETEAGPQ